MKLKGLALAFVMAAFSGAMLSAQCYDKTGKEISCTEHPQSGVFEVYSKDGIIQKKETYKNGKLNGKSTTFYENGKIEKVENYKNGALNGTTKVYYGNGKIKSKQNYLNGVKNGLSVSYDEFGDVSERSNFRNGETVSDGSGADYDNGSSNGAGSYD